MSNDTIAMADKATQLEVSEKFDHRFGKNCHHRCITDTRGFATPGNVNLTELVVDTHLGFVPLWARNVTLRWRFNERSFAMAADPESRKLEVRNLMRESLALWDTAVPVRFSEQRDLWDFEVVLVPRPDCDNGGCVLASAFFPDSGRHALHIYPTMFNQDRTEQVETLAHEFGHIFGLRHWFAAISEASWPSAIFGSHDRFSIMNYGDASTLTPADRNDLVALYQAVWDGRLTQINNTPIKLFKPFSANY